MRAAIVAVVVAGAVFAATSGVLAVGLAPPTRGSLAVARAAQTLGRYRYVSSVIYVGGRRVPAECYHGWFEDHRGSYVRGTLLRLGRRDWVRVLRSQRVRADGRFAMSPFDALELAGCSRVLAPRLAAYAESHAIRIRALRGTGDVALRLHELTLLVSRRADVPVGIELDGNRSIIRLTPFTPQLARRLRVST